MTNAEKVEKRAIMCWRVLVQLNDLYPSAGSATFEHALRPNGPTVAAYNPEVERSPEMIEAIDLTRRMLSERGIEGRVHIHGVNSATIPANIRRGLSKRDPNGTTSIVDTVEAALKTLDANGSVRQGEFTRWAREAGFEP